MCSKQAIVSEEDSVEMVQHPFKLSCRQMLQIKRMPLLFVCCVMGHQLPLSSFQQLSSLPESSQSKGTFCQLFIFRNGKFNQNYCTHTHLNSHGKSHSKNIKMFQFLQLLIFNSMKFNKDFRQLLLSAHYRSLLLQNDYHFEEEENFKRIIFTLEIFNSKFRNGKKYLIIPFSFYNCFL